MSNISYSVDQIHPLNKLAPTILASLVGISLLGWIIQSVQIRFLPYRVHILILLSHLFIFIQLILRAVYSNNLSTNSPTVSTVLAVTLAAGQRTIIVANYDFFLLFHTTKVCSSRFILTAAILCVVSSAIITIISTRLAENANTINRSFQLRQVATAIILCLTVFFYPIWLIRDSILKMTKQAIVLLVISGWSCLIVAIYLLISSIPQYYYQTTEEAYWFYIFHLIPMIIALLTWTIFHPKRSLKCIQHEIIEQDATDLYQTT